jgi:polyferredoxin
MVALLLLASVAFVRKRPGLRWATLAVTLGYLGFFDGGFLSVSHITSAIWVGGSAFLGNVPLLLLASFTVVTTLVFGRVFCGFLCPFGALQDVLTRLVPRRFRRRVPGRVHRRALWVKYGVLAVILVPAAAGIHTSIYPYFEPFGTVFFLSPSWILWTIAAGFIGASAVVPRFYCRYACPLGAALALGSLVAPRRIARVEHCSHCRVCETACPTGAIRGATIDFKECVRCNACETLLIREAGVCGHDLDEVRSRLVQLQVRSAGGSR